MTYITYIKKQSSDYKQKGTVRLDSEFSVYHNVPGYKIEGVYRYSKPPKRIPLILPKLDFMPTYLVRTSDMKLVPGSEVHEGYCT